jgi:hypothetical protein
MWGCGALPARLVYLLIYAMAQCIVLQTAKSDTYFTIKQPGYVHLAKQVFRASVIIIVNTTSQ